MEHSAILLTFIKLPFVFQTFVLSIFEGPLKTGFTVNVLQTIRSLNDLVSAVYIAGSPSYIEKRGFDYDEPDPELSSSGMLSFYLQYCTWSDCVIIR